MMQKLRHALGSKLILFLVFVLFGSFLSLPARATVKLVGPFNRINGYILTNDGFAYSYEDPTNSKKKNVVINDVPYGSFYDLTNVHLFNDGSWVFSYRDDSSVNSYLKSDRGTYTIKPVRGGESGVFFVNNENYAAVLADGCSSGFNPINNGCSVVWKAASGAQQINTLKDLGLEDNYNLEQIFVSTNGFLMSARLSGSNDFYIFTKIKSDGMKVKKYGPFVSLSDVLVNAAITPNHYAFLYRKNTDTRVVYMNFDGQEYGPVEPNSPIGFYGQGDAIILRSVTNNNIVGTFVNGKWLDSQGCYFTLDSSLAINKYNNAFFGNYYCSTDAGAKYYIYNIYNQSYTWDGVMSDGSTGIYQHMFESTYGKRSVVSDRLALGGIEVYNYNRGNCVNSVYLNNLISVYVNGVKLDENTSNPRLASYSIEEPLINGNGWAYEFYKDGKYYIRYGLNESNPSGAGCDYGTADAKECDLKSYNGSTYIFYNGQYRKFDNDAVFLKFGYLVSDIVPSTVALSPLGNVISDVDSSILAKCPGKVSKNTCTDNDSGVNYNVSSNVYGVYKGNNFTENDSCQNTTSVIEWTCDYDNVGGMIAKSQTYDCPNGCLNGACRQTKLVVPTCVDSDDKNIFNKGYVSGLDINGRTYTTYDTCLGSSQVAEMWCYDYNGGKVAGKVAYNCTNGCEDGACKPEVVVNKTSEAITCNKSLNSYKYLSGFADNDTLSSIINNDAKLKLLVQQVLANKAQISGLTGSHLNDNQVPSTNEPVIGDCKWLDPAQTGNWHIYSYQAGGKVSLGADISSYNIGDAQNRMARAIKEGYCCCRKSLVVKTTSESARLVLNSGQTNAGLKALLQSVGKADNTKNRTANYNKYAVPLNTKYGQISTFKLYAISNFITFGASGATAKMTPAQRYQLILKFAQENNDLPSNLVEWTTILDNVGDQSVLGTKIMYYGGKLFRK